MSIDLTNTVIYPQCVVYHNALPDVKRLLEIVKETEQEGFIQEGDLFQPWRDWYGFGIMSDCTMADVNSEVENPKPGDERVEKQNIL